MEREIKKEKEKECPLKSQMFCSALLHSCASVVYRVLRSSIPGRREVTVVTAGYPGGLKRVFLPISRWSESI